MLNITLRSDIISSRVVGEVEIRTSKASKIKEISLDIIGKETTKLRKTVHSSNGSRRVTVRETNFFLSHKALVSIPGYPIGTTTIPAGEYSIPFSYTIPENLPHSCRYERKAQIEYYVQAELSIGSHGILKKLKNAFSLPIRAVQPFTVIGNLNKIMVEESLALETFSNSKSFLLSRSSKVLRIQGTIPCKMAQRGDTVPLFVDIRNYSNRVVHELQVELIQEQFAKAVDSWHSKKHCNSVTIVQKIHKLPTPIQKGQKIINHEVPLTIPTDISPTLHGKNFQQLYSINIIARSSGDGSLLKTTLPKFYVYDDPDNRLQTLLKPKKGKDTSPLSELPKEEALLDFLLPDDNDHMKDADGTEETGF
uniref:Arrestin C-terminal-like domain-containing protein n=1 Tax=Vannella robusta TaxID=1487602 RepID=A0A7S4MA22_9EUKA|mmetsp:Transcript_15923/g.20282  ORF Transcript_15923/g.20282 Transcript_15923/m.20282 type:complete len:365 (+) Transcript_15923:33-1127(+)